MRSCRRIRHEQNRADFKVTASPEDSGRARSGTVALSFAWNTPLIRELRSTSRQAPLDCPPARENSGTEVALAARRARETISKPRHHISAADRYRTLSRPEARSPIVAPFAAASASHRGIQSRKSTVSCQRLLPSRLVITTSCRLQSCVILATESRYDTSLADPHIPPLWNCGNAHFSDP